MSTSWRRRLVDRWPLEPGDSLLIVFATFVGVVWAFIAFDLAVTLDLDLSLHIAGIADAVRAAVLWPTSVFLLTLALLERIGHLPEGASIWLLVIASGAVPGALAGLLGVAWLHRG